MKKILVLMELGCIVAVIATIFILSMAYTKSHQQYNYVNSAKENKAITHFTKVSNSFIQGKS